MNVSRLAQQLKLTPKQLLELLPQLGFHVGARAQKIDDRQVDRIMIAIKSHLRLQAMKLQEQSVREIRGKDGEIKQTRAVIIPETIVVKDLADALGYPLQRVMAEMMKNGIMASLNERLDFDTASIISEDLGFTVTRAEAQELDGADVAKRAKLEELLSARAGTFKRPPVVVVMGHVDHGKTKLLDAVRKTHIMEGEAGGITQHIGAYQTEILSKGEIRPITFLDTPGHEAFKAMRSRGGQIADVAILVVAADDGIQPQTLESFAIIQNEKLPFIVAINKIDKESADIDRLKQQLTEINLTPEDWGGKTICVPISAKQGTNIQDLLEMVLLVADIEDLTADPNGDAIGTIIESHVDKGEGPVATVLIQAGTLCINDLLIVGPVAGKVKALKDWTGKDVTEATPGMPVKILGLKGLPEVGELMTVAHDRADYNDLLKQQQKLITLRKPRTVSVNGKQEEASSDIPSVNVLIRADVLGSLEAIEAALEKISTSDAMVRIVKRGLGFVTESDILTAQATNALVLSFHLKENRKITSLAEERDVIIRYYDVIYHLLEEIQKRLDLLKKPKLTRELIGKLKLLKVFKVANKTTICGGRVIEGLIKAGAKIKILRGTEVVAFGSATNVQMNRENVKEAAAPNEVGLELACDPVLVENDIIEFFTEK